MFAAVGLGLGVGVLLFMWQTGAFDRVHGIEDLGTVVLGGVALAVAFGFGLLIGVVMAIFAGMFAANAASSRMSAVVTGMVAGAVGHVGLVVALGAVLLAGFAALDQGRPTPPVRTSAPGEPPCEEIFGADSPVCQNQTPESSIDAVEADDEVTVGNVARLGLGVIPAALVGGLTAAILFARKRRP